MTIPHGEVLPASASTSGFRDPGTLTRSLKLFLYLGIGLGPLSLVSQLLELQLLNELQAGRAPAPGAAASNDFRQQIISAIRVVNIVVIIVLFCIWIHRANYNARQLGA